MSVEAVQEFLLPLGDLPQPAPSRKIDARPQTRKPSRVRQAIDACDWDAYEENVFSLLRAAVEDYLRQSSGEEVYQISIWTDPQTQVSAVSFETKKHAEEHISKWAQIFRQKYADEETAARLEADGYNNNPADFKHSRLLERKHPELVAIDGLDYRYVTHQHAAGARISASLRKVVKRAREQNALADLPREEIVWIGVNSPRDWYDHVTKI